MDFPNLPGFLSSCDAPLHPPSNYHQVLGRSKDLAMGVGLGCIASQGKPWKTHGIRLVQYGCMIDGSIMKMDHGPLYWTMILDI